jgi:hypothetical protein
MPGLISGSVNSHQFPGFCAFPTVTSATLFTDSHEEDGCITQNIIQQDCILQKRYIALNHICLWLISYLQ